jgi:serine/threonine protein phosphatase PrpC
VPNSLSGFRVLPRFDFRVGIALSTDPGKRSSQQDVALAVPEVALFVVADGMGGHPAGDVAAALAADAVRRAVRERAAQRAADAYVREPDLDSRRRLFAVLRSAVEDANDRVLAAADRDPRRKGMGTTLDVVWLARDHAFVAHVGDSRVYLARSSAVLQLTQDHAESAEAAVRGERRPRRRRRRGYDCLLNAVGLAPKITVDTLFVDLRRGDRLLLCSDGIHGAVGPEAVLGEILREGTAEDAARTLVARGVEQGDDNATAVVIEVGDRFVARGSHDRGLGSADLELVRSSALLAELSFPEVMATLAAGVQVELRAGERVGRAVTNDLVSYIVLEGIVRCSGDRLMGQGALLFPESLVGVGSSDALPLVEQRARLLRIRADDFEEVCASEPELGIRLYRRVAQHIARLATRGLSTQAIPSLVPPARGPWDD